MLKGWVERQAARQAEEKASRARVSEGADRVLAAMLAELERPEVVSTEGAQIAAVVAFRLRRSAGVAYICDVMERDKELCAAYERSVKEAGGG